VTIPAPSDSFPSVRIGASTDTGRVRTENEDSYVVAPRVFAVADGMGGHAAGEVASALAVTILNDRLADGAASVDVAIAAVVEANAAIFHGAHNNAAQRGMGTTLTAMTVLQPATAGDPDRFVLLNVGDSRGYLYRSRQLRRATIDHSYVQELVATGHISEDEARTHPRRNIVTRALGIEPSVRVDSWVLPLVRADRFVLCSDGLVDEVTDDQIAAIVAANPDPQAAADQLVATANANGGRDNVTVLVIDVLDGIDAPLDDDTFDDTAMWAGSSGLGSLVDAEAGNADEASAATMATPTLPRLAATPTDLSAPAAIAVGMGGAAAGVATVPAASVAAKRRFGIGTLLFGIALAAILTVTIVFIAAAISNSGDETPAVTTVLPSTTLATSTTTASTTTAATSTTTATTTTATSPPTISTGP
jgi:serine/threonine protein phosphatase PrpC